MPMLQEPLKTRMRRLRRLPGLRRLCRQTALCVDDFILPVFVDAKCKQRQAIEALPGQYRYSLADLPAYLHTIAASGIPAILLFGLPQYKDAKGSASWQDDGIIQQTIALCKQHAPDVVVMADLCFCSFTDHGHCGVLAKGSKTGHVDNDATLSLLAKQALSLAKAGVDVLAPSGMVDGMIATLRQALDADGYHDTALLSYAVKYHSHLYGPFRAAADGAPSFGDRSGYQMHYANASEALREAQLDIDEGADFIMVKPAHTYLDILFAIKQQFPGVPLAAYHVSGEYAMVHAAAARGWVDEQAVMMEILTAMKRAGADMLISYAALHVASWLQEQ